MLIDSPTSSGDPATNLVNEINRAGNLSPTATAMLAEAQAQLDAYPASEVTEIPEDGNYDFRLTEQGLLHSQVCTRKTPEEAVEWLTRVRPALGTRTGRWVLGGEDDPPPVTCEQFPATHTHVLVYC